MLFNSFEFLTFLLVVYGLYRVLPFRAQNRMLLVAGYIFYGWWDWRFLALMIFSTTVDFWVGLLLDRGKLTRWQALFPATFVFVAALLLVGLDFSAVMHALVGQIPTHSVISPQMTWILIGGPALFLAGFFIYKIVLPMDERIRRKICVLISLTIQLGILAVYKYFNFFAESLVESLQSVGINVSPGHFNIVLPVGISFYTFQSLSYTIDIYRREIRPTDKFLDFALFVSFFPQLVAGPIERARNLIPQLSRPRPIDFLVTTRGLFLIVLGLFKKVAIADGVAPFVDQVYNSSGNVSWADVVLATVLFAVQIYADFSGYSDIARGTARLLGVELMVNFRQPYFAKSPRDFWQRWHISLSTWLGDYLYKPLGGSRGSLAFTCRNLMLTMLLGGLWHGAAWNYVLWGFYHGSILSIHRVLVSVRGEANLLQGRIISTVKIVSFGFVTLYGWLLFRARSFHQVSEFTRIIFTDLGNFTIGPRVPALSALLGILLLGGFEIAQYNAGNGSPRYYQRWPAPAIGLFIAAMMFLIFMGMSNEPAQFIYFQF
ncbi:MAG: MBOAT family O-acyltransferase [Sphingomonadaceae bacterium]